MAWTSGCSSTPRPNTVPAVDLGVRAHRNRPLPELGPMATIVLLTMLHRAGVDAVPADVVVDQPVLGPVEVRYAERPPLVTIAEYLAAHPR
jgi:glucosyl-3-phosphoglycerate synthase